MVEKMNPRSIKILSYIDANGGRVLISELNNVTELGARYIAPLTVGRLPNCIKENEYIVLTEKGLRTLREAGVTVTQQIAPIVKREHSGSHSIINITIDRNSDVKISCQLSPSFVEFLKATGRSQNVISSKGSSFARNWDCTEDTNFIAIDLKEFDQNFSDATNIITDYGINSFIIKLAGANGGYWNVTYKGLVSKEKLVSYANKLKDSAKSFYYSYVKPVKITISLNVVE